MGASGVETCEPCPEGTWSSQRGASGQGACARCPRGTYQPLAGQALPGSCQSCPLGTYGAAAGASACASCPQGSWAGALEQTACARCPLGTWTLMGGLTREADCKPCLGAAECPVPLPAHITLVMQNVSFAGVPPGTSARLAQAYAQAMASACGIQANAVVDLHGRNGTATLAPGGVVSAFAFLDTRFGINDVAVRLSSLLFQSQMTWSTMSVLASEPSAMSGYPTTGVVSVVPDQFQPLPGTTAPSTPIDTIVQQERQTNLTTTREPTVLEGRRMHSAWLPSVIGDIIGAAFMVLFVTVAAHDLWVKRAGRARAAEGGGDGGGPGQEVRREVPEGSLPQGASVAEHREQAAPPAAVHDAPDPPDCGTDPCDSTIAAAEGSSDVTFDHDHSFFLPDLEVGRSTVDGTQLEGHTVTAGCWQCW